MRAANPLGKRGEPVSPRRLAAKTKAAKGTLRPHREPRAAASLDTLAVPPSLRQPRERQAFQDLVALLAAERKLFASSAVALEAMARDLAMNRQAQEHLAEDGLFFTNGETGLRRAHPAAALLDQSSKRLRGWCTELGLTSASAGRVAQAPAERPVTFAGLLRGAQ